MSQIPILGPSFYFMTKKNRNSRVPLVALFKPHLHDTTEGKNLNFWICTIFVRIDHMYMYVCV